MEGNVTETPRETRVLDAVVSLVDTLLDAADHAAIVDTP